MHGAWPFWTFIKVIHNTRALRFKNGVVLLKDTENGDEIQCGDMFVGPNNKNVRDTIFECGNEEGIWATELTVRLEGDEKKVLQVNQVVVLHRDEEMMEAPMGT